LQAFSMIFCCFWFVIELVAWSVFFPLPDIWASLNV
jgi:hypothetical protein